jgi:hypothetical protein
MKKLFGIGVISTMFGIASADTIQKYDSRIFNNTQRPMGMSFGGSYSQNENPKANYYISLPVPPPPMPGAGYSSDSDTIAPSVCFNYETATRGEQTATLSNLSIIDVATLANKFGINLNNVKVSYKGFEVGGTAQYLKEHQETDTAYSINYYYKVALLKSEIILIYTVKIF